MPARTRGTPGWWRCSDRSARGELGQVAPMPGEEALVDAGVGVVAKLADAIAAKSEHHAGALIHHVLRRRAEPAALADLDDDALVGLVPLTPDILVSPVRNAQPRLSIGHRPEHGLPPVPFAADRWIPGHPVGHVVGERRAHLVHPAGEQRRLIGARDSHALAQGATSSS